MNELKKRAEHVLIELINLCYSFFINWVFSSFRIENRAIPIRNLKWNDLLGFWLVFSNISSFNFQRRANRTLPFYAIFLAPISINGHCPLGRPNIKPEPRSICLLIDVNPVNVECFASGRARGQQFLIQNRCQDVNRWTWTQWATWPRRLVNVMAIKHIFVNMNLFIT